MALTYSASTDKTTIASAANITNLVAGTIISWVKPASVSGVNGQRIVQKATLAENAGAFLYLTIRETSDGDFCFEYARNTSDTKIISSGSVVSAGAWQYLAAVFDTAGANSDQKLFIGTLTSLAVEPSYATQTVGSGTIKSNAGANLTIGNKNNNNAPLKGDIGLLMIFNRKLTQGEIQSLQFNPRPISGCVYYGLPGSNGTGTQPDYSGAGHRSSACAATAVVGNMPINFGQFLSFNSYVPTPVTSRIPRHIMKSNFRVEPAYLQ